MMTNAKKSIVSWKVGILLTLLLVGILIMPNFLLAQPIPDLTIPTVPIGDLLNSTPRADTSVQIPNPPCEYRLGEPINLPCIGNGLGDNNTLRTKATGEGWDPLAWLNPFKWVPAVISFIAYYIMKVTALILGLAGLLLNGVINKTIIGMSAGIAGMSGINTAWKVIRDFMNIAFIFLLVYEGIKMIVGQGDIGQVKKFITGIVMASLLINFSLFFTKVMIDASNVITVGIYNQMIGDENGTSTGYDRGLANAYMQSLGVQGLYGTIDVGAGGDYYSQLTANIGAAILFIVASFVFLAISVMLVVRYIALIILLMLSPIAYMGLVGGAFSGMKKQVDEWWNTFWGQLIFAPLFMIMTWVVLTVISAGDFAGAPIKNGASFTNVDGTINVIFNFTVIIGLMIASLTLAKTEANKGSKMVGALTSKLNKYAGDSTMGAAARLGRITLGRKGDRWANDEGLKERASGGGFGGWAARRQLELGNKMAKSTFDARATTGLSELAGQAGMGKDPFGKVDLKKDTYKGIQEERDKKAKAHAEMYKPGSEAYATAKAANEKLKDGKFKEEEENRKKEYYSSQKWKDTDEGKAEEEANKAITEHEKALEEVKKADEEALKADEAIKTSENEALAMKAEIDKKRTELANTTDNDIDQSLKAEIRDLEEQIKHKNEQTETAKVDAESKKQNVESAKQRAENLKTVADGARETLSKIDAGKSEWKSDVKIALEKDSEMGDTAYINRVTRVANRHKHILDKYTPEEVKAAQKADTEAKNEAKRRLASEENLSSSERKKLEKEAENGIDAEKKLRSDMKGVWRGVANVAGSIAHITGVMGYAPGMPRTLAERRAYADALIKQTKAETTEQELIRIQKKLQAEQRKKDKAEGKKLEDEEDEPKVEPEKPPEEPKTTQP